jgi:hypothetical protein
MQESYYVVRFKNDVGVKGLTESAVCKYWKYKRLIVVHDKYKYCL